MPPYNPCTASSWFWRRARCRTRRQSAFATRAMHPVGTLDTLGLSVYQNPGDGKCWFKEDGVRVKVHGNCRWTTLSGEARRGQGQAASFSSPHDASEASSVSSESDSDEGGGWRNNDADVDGQQLLEAIAASLAAHTGGSTIAAQFSTVEPAAVGVASTDEEEREQIARAIAASLGHSSGAATATGPTPASTPSDAAAATPPQCSICMDDLSNGQDVQALRCTHSFHKRCIEPWLRTSRTCPTCRERA